MLCRSEVTKVAAICGAVLVLGTLGGPGAPWFAASGARAAGGPRSYTLSSFLLQLDGSDVALAQRFSGGEAVADVKVESAGAASFASKRVGQVRYRDLAVEVGLDAAAPVHQWIAEAWDARASRKSGAVVVMDQDLKAKERLNFKDALLTGVTVPALDASGPKAAGFLTLQLSPARTSYETLSDGAAAATTLAKAGQKAFLVSNFRLELGDLDTKGVVKIAAFTVKQAVSEQVMGGERFTQKEATMPEFPNLEVTVTTEAAAAFRKWHQDFVINGNADDKHEKSGAIVLLGHDAKTELARISLSNVGIVRVSSGTSEASTETVRRVTVELYVERMRFSSPGSAGAKVARSARAL